MAKKILIVDDREDILLILVREFRRVPGLSVISTNKISEALAMVPAHCVDLVISDVRLGADSGFDLVRELMRSHPGVGSILMSAYRSPRNRQEAEDLGVLLFLEKPFQVATLLEVVKNFFHLREALGPPPAPAPVPAPAGTLAPPNPRALGIDKTNSLIHFKLEDLVQLFCLNGRNILITVHTGADQPTGEIYIQRGRIVHAEFNGQTGDEGFLSLMQLPGARLNVKDWTSPVPVTVVSTWEYLLLKSAVHSDHHPERKAAKGG